MVGVKPSIGGLSQAKMPGNARQCWCFSFFGVIRSGNRTPVRGRLCACAYCCVSVWPILSGIPGMLTAKNLSGDWHVVAGSLPAQPLWLFPAVGGCPAVLLPAQPLWLFPRSWLMPCGFAPSPAVVGEGWDGGVPIRALLFHLRIDPIPTLSPGEGVNPRPAVLLPALLLNSNAFPAITKADPGNCLMAIAGVKRNLVSPADPRFPALSMRVVQFGRHMLSG